jgi:protein-S-isoprenylcysteine O-methyltransferase Ste14
MNTSLLQERIDILHKITTGSKKVRMLLTPVGLLFFLGTITLLVVLAPWIDRLLGFPKLFGSPSSRAIGVAVLAIGLFLVLWSNLHFLKMKGTPVPFNPPPKLVTTGPYAFARNPMVTGVVLVVLGLGLFYGSITLVFFFTPLVVAVSVCELKIIEEPELEKRLGKEYVEYKNRVPMFFPWVKVRTK